jgi:endothelin-converting enzyme/putative endopeptidase
MQKLLPHFELVAYQKALGAPQAGKANDMEPKFFAEFDAVMADLPVETVRTYLRWHLLHAYAGTSLPESFDKENWNFYSHTLNGAEKQQERWKRCTSRIDHEMGEALGQVWAAKYFPPAEKQRTLEMTVAIESAMDKDIDNLDWMSAETKTRAKEKLHTVMNKVGYPDKWRDYSKLEIVRGDALGNSLRYHQFLNEDRQAGGQGGVDDDAADGECLLRSAAEQCELPGRLFAAAVLQRQGR